MTDTSNDQGIPAPEGAADIIDTNYEIGQDNVDGSFGSLGFDIHNPVFLYAGFAGAGGKRVFSDVFLYHHEL